MSSLELAAQVSALVGTSALLFFATKPRQLFQETSELPPQELRGIKRYSSYHRKRYYSTISDMSTASSTSATSL